MRPHQESPASQTAAKPTPSTPWATWHWPLTTSHRRLDTIPAGHTSRVHAQRLGLQGEAQFTTGDLARAEQSLRTAAEQFGEIREFWSQADAQLLLGSIQLKAGRLSAAYFSLLAAMETFQRCGDGRSADRALAMLAHPALVLSARAASARIKCRLLRIPGVRPGTPSARPAKHAGPPR